MAKIRLSVVIPTRNRPESLDTLLTDLLQQTLPIPEYEVIVVDDGSTPPIAETALKEKFSLNLRVLRRDADHGAHQSRADGARIARGARTLFLDDDVALAPSVLADHAVDDGNFSVGPIFYRDDPLQNAYSRMQASYYRQYFGELIKGPHLTRDVEFFICNASGSSATFSEFLDAVQEAMRGVPLGGEGFDESIMHIEATMRGYWFRILPDAVVWHVDTRSLADARRGKRRNGGIACQLALDPARRGNEINRIFDLAGVLSGRQGRCKQLRARLVWQGSLVVDPIADLLAFVADRGPKRWTPGWLCKLPMTVAFWQGVREVAPSWNGLRKSLAADD